jgi:hypothetical protein
MSHAVSTNPKHCKVFLLGTSALVCLALAAPVMAADFVITESDDSTNGKGTKDGGTAAAIADTAIDGSDTVSLGITLTTTETNTIGIRTSNVDNVADGNAITVTEAGSISTTGINGFGIFNSGDDNTTTMSGSISTTGKDGYGIWNLGSSNTTTISGSISITGSRGGVFYYGDDNTTTMSGSISTTGLLGFGIWNYGSGNTTTMSGSISTTGMGGFGIWNIGSGNTTTISGSIKTEGAGAHGIYNEGSDNTTTISGSIKTEGEGAGAHGIYNEGSDNTTTMSGSISTTGEKAYGIYNNGDNNTTTISGSIKTEGAGAHGIYNDGDNNTTTISGTVKATGAKSAALYNVYGSGNSFTLNEGATIIGDILASDATNNAADATNSKLIFNLGASTSYAYSVSGKGEGTGAGQWTFSDLDGRTQGVTTTGTGCDTTITDAGNDTCNLVTAVGAANAEVQNELQYITSTSLINSLRLDTPVNTSQEETTATDVWFDAYGVSTERDASTWDTTGVVFNADTRGLTIGKPLVLGESFGLDLVFNTSQTDLDVGATKHQNIAAQSFNFGVVMTDLASSSNWDVDAFGFIGRNSYEGKRKVMNNQVPTGSETVTSSYSGTKALVGFDVDYTTPINEAVSFKGGINANLSNEKIGAYSESKYSTWNARTLLQAASGISAGLTHKRDLLSTFVTLGAEYSSLLSGEKASYTNNGTATSYTDHDASDDMISSVAVGFKYAGTNGVSFEGSIKGSSSNKGLTSTSANFGLNWAF